MNIDDYVDMYEDLQYSKKKFLYATGFRENMLHLLAKTLSHGIHKKLLMFKITKTMLNKPGRTINTYI